MSNKLFVSRAQTVLIEYLRLQNFSERTLALRLFGIRVFYRYVQTTRLRDLREMDELFLCRFRSWLDTQVTRYTRKPLAAGTKRCIIIAVKQLFQSVYHTGLILTNPARQLSSPQQRGHARVILTTGEMDLLLTSITHGRDRAIFELMYSSALRVGEVLRLRCDDIDFAGKRLRIRKSKFGKDRVVPVNASALQWVNRYRDSRRKKTGALLFPGWSKGGMLQGDTINKRLKTYAREAGVMKPGFSSHSLRHSCATHLLESGASFLDVGRLLGHSSLETTVAYTTHLDVSLPGMYRSHHPGENLFFRSVSNEYREQLKKLEDRLEKP